MQESIPRHIAIIPDGNRRWGELHGVSREEAYSTGISKISDVAKWCRDANVGILTMWGFSSDNFSRDKNEVSTLFKLFQKNLISILTSEGEERRKIRVRFLGRTSLFPREMQTLMRKVERDTEKNKDYQLNLLLSYGGRNEIIDAVNSIMKKGIKKVDEETISNHLYTSDIPDPDLIIRTSGERRLSGLMPWQTVYSEMYFCEKLWPDFSIEDFNAALEEFSNRRRRYGR